jgi:hypothetical protein
MVALITNTRTKERKAISLLEWHAGRNPNTITLEQAADRIIKRIACTYPKAYKLIHNRENHIDIMAGNITKCVFEIRAVEELRDYDDSFLS